MLGEYRKGEHHVWLGPDCAIGKDGFLDPSPVIYVPSGASLDKRVSYLPTDDDTFLEIASDCPEDVGFGSYDVGVVATQFGIQYLF